jgi:TolA-binding protein
MNYQQYLTNSLSGASLLMLIVLAVITATVTVFGCSWLGTSHSVRFNDYQTEREMGRLPPLPTMANGMNQARARWDEGDYEGYEEAEAQEKKIDDLWERAEAAEKDGNLRLAPNLLNQYLKDTAGPREISAHRNSAFDRLDAFTALDQGSSESAVKAYLDARRFHDAEKPDAKPVNQLSEEASRDRNLVDNFAYLRAAALYKQHNFAESAQAFAEVTRKFPHSEKREAALLMTAIATMKTSATYIPFSGNADWDYDDKTPKLPADQAWHDAFKAFQKALSEYPRGKYFNDTRGWLAYLHLRVGDRVSALIQYYRLLGDEHDENARVEGAFSLMLVRSPATDDEMDRVEKALANEPPAALAYAYHNIYNHSIDPGPIDPPYEDKPIKDSSGQTDYEAERLRTEEAEKKWKAERAATSQKELIRTLEFSKRLMANYPNLSVGGAFALRAAQASEELNDNSTAIQFGQRALKNNLSGEQREQALWTLGIAQHRLRQFDSARKSLTTLIRDYPKSSLVEGARRAVAMIAEDAGDIDAALEQYIALKYKIDQGYLIDYLMTPEQLAAFIEKHPDSIKRNEFTYALGVRYLRLNRWDEARKTLAQVETAPLSNYYYYCGSCRCDAAGNCIDPKTNALSIDEDDSGRKEIPPALVMRDVQTVNDLEALERAANQAVGDEAKAEALYQYASYQYEANSLLFYNPLATPRYYNLGTLAGYGRYRAPNEAQILFASQQEHERLARALKIYLQVVTNYPHTRAARDALYTAAVCHERLSNYNPYWRGIYENGLHAGDRMVTYEVVKATYARYQLPQGTYGWQPSTRTVNNGPGWAPPPPPPPKLKRLTKRERLKLFVNDVSNRINVLWQEKGKRWLTESLIVFVLVFTVRIARKNQRRLRARLARQRIQQAKQLVTYPWFDWFWIDPIVPTRREQIRTLLGDKRQEFIDLARDRRSRPALLRSIVSHSAVTGLVVGLVWTVWFG